MDLPFRALLFLFAFLLFAPAALAQAGGTAVIYQNAACGHCTPYLAELVPLLESRGFAVERRDLINDFSARLEWVSQNQSRDIPVEMQGHMRTVLNGTLFLEGHVPLSLATELIDRHPHGRFPEMLVYQDSMLAPEKLESYRVMQNGTVTECAIDTPIAQCQGEAVLDSDTPLWMLVLFTGLLAGIHPCTIAVLLLFLAFLLALRRSRISLFAIGGAYVLGVFLAYFFIGLGLMQAANFGSPHFFAKVASALIVALGAYTLYRVFAPHAPALGIPQSAKKPITGLVQRASIPAALLVGIVVGICAFGCTAGIYLALIGFAVTQPGTGALYLLFYNLLFILPLILILVAVTNKKTLSRIDLAEKQNARKLRLFTALSLLAMGAALALVAWGVI